MEDYELEKSIYGWTMKIGNKSYYDVPEDYALIIEQLENKYTIEKNKNDKAIEYIEDNRSYTTIEKFVSMNMFNKHDEDILTEEMINDLLKILRGEDNE